MDDTTGRVTPGSDEETELRTQEIREEIAQTRVDMAETIEAIQERLTPSHLVAQAGETVRNATTEKVKQMANTAGHAVDEVMDTSFVQTLKSNPVPAAMIGVGAAWLLIKGRSDANREDRIRHYSRYRTRTAYGSGSAYGGSAYGSSEAYGSGAYDAGAYGRDRDWRTTGAAGETAVGTTGYGDYGTGGTGESSPAWQSGNESWNYTRYRRQGMSFDRVVRDNPLVVGAAAALVGVAIGMSIPASETENRLMGETRDSVVDRARGLASEAAEKVQDVAGQAANAATQVRDAAARATGTAGQSSNVQGGASTAANDTSSGGIDTGSTGSTGTGRTPRSTTRRGTS